MRNEIEAQFLDIDKDAVRAKLKEIGAKLEKPKVTFDMKPPKWAEKGIVI